MRWIPDAQLELLTRSAAVPELIADRYQIVDTIGAGGMGVVYRAEDTALRRTVAIKVIDADESEARVLAKLEHPGIVPVHDVGLLPDGRVFYVMKLVDGTTLADFRGSLAERLRVFARICDAVAFAHSRGVVHRDLTPRNVMVGAFGETVVLDWGLAHGDARGGTRGFIAPEGQLDERSDLYSLGAILQFLVGNEATPPLRAIARKATAPEPTARYASARELGEDVLRYLDAAPVRAHRYTPFETARRWIVRNRVIVGLIAAYVAMRVAAAVFLH
ncbi:MAG: serine/threonine protein kinase [Acidobacteria bacterium]|nr:serine/threonine protein kinase [Acidobacteriota bacterium]